MPELPEVETICRGLEPAISGKVITAVQQRRKDLRVPFPKNLKGKLEGRAILYIRRRAKYIVIGLGSAVSNQTVEATLIIHLGMSGRIIIAREPYTPEKHDHLLLSFKGGTCIVLNDPRRFGMVLYNKGEDIEALQSFHKMGPEPLGNHFHGESLYEALQKRSTSIKNALLNQHVVAGLGNIYVCEALFLAGIHPEENTRNISNRKADKLVRAIRDVLRQAIKAGGSTLKDYRKADGSLGYFQYAFAVYDREGQACPNCTCRAKEKVIRIQQAGRSTFFCAKKQKKAA